MRGARAPAIAGLTLALAESLTGGLLAGRITAHAGFSDVFRGAVVPYHRDLKQSVLGAPDVPAVSEEMVTAMADGARTVLGADVALAVSGVAGPEPHEGLDPGVVWIGLALDGTTEAVTLTLPFDRERIRQFTCIMALNLLRTRLLARG
ncbi:MAG: CinA family protein [Acidimicrobiales bacterium]